ncbi:hypothetical protein DCC62_09945 [candidate division KSB1 bacterium]|nr:MAG: hypothetical protein DCC62_09945 [candidate division KSB1 bacterium]
MTKGYRFDNLNPSVGSEHHAFRTLTDCEKFVRLQGGLKGGMRIYEIEGTLVRDEGGPDGLVIIVNRYRKVQ